MMCFQCGADICAPATGNTELFSSIVVPEAKRIVQRLVETVPACDSTAANNATPSVIAGGAQWFRHPHRIRVDLEILGDGHSLVESRWCTVRGIDSRIVQRDC